MEEAIIRLMERDPALMIPIIFVLDMGVIGVVAIVFGTISSMVTSREQERTRREIAAYIAEGSMTPEDGERLLTAGMKSGKRNRGRC